jgi:hypothetical protein
MDGSYRAQAYFSFIPMESVAGGDLLVSSSLLGRKLFLWNLRTGQLLKVYSAPMVQSIDEEVADLVYLKNLNAFVILSKGQMYLWGFPACTQSQEELSSIQRRKKLSSIQRRMLCFLGEEYDYGFSPPISILDYQATRDGIGNNDSWVQQQLAEANRLYMEFIEVWGLGWVPEDLQAKMEIVKRVLH